jgi:mRNA-degrading endonuclease toxin of MazEF toxin-antitoxin module
MHDPARRGELRLVAPTDSTSDAGHRLVLVLSTDDRSQLATVALVHTSTEFATSFDVIVPAARTGTPFSVVVQSDLRGAVHQAQLGRSVGQLADETLDAANDRLTHGGPGEWDGVRTGVRIGGECDRRWAFKVTEGAALDGLTATVYP